MQQVLKCTEMLTVKKETRNIASVEKTTLKNHAMLLKVNKGCKKGGRIERVEKKTSKIVNSKQVNED